MNQSPPKLSGPITFQGDVHGKLTELAQAGHPVIQVGDLGVGFVKPIAMQTRVKNRDDFWFIRGNHDAPDECRGNPRYLGEFGMIDDLFFASGAWSIDRMYRVEGVSWWADEELTATQMQEAFDLYVASSPRVVVTHDAPAELFSTGGPMEIPHFNSSATADFLQRCFEEHQPELWIFGHHHRSRDFELKGTRFRCLAEFETMTVEF